MRTLFLILSIILMAQQGFAQKRLGSDSKKNEVRLNTLYLPAGYPELTYERALGRKSAIGITAGGFIGSPGPNYATDMITSDFAFLPHYRYYFGKRITSGFFIENNINIFYNEYDLGDENGFGVGLGLAVGAKFNLNNNWSVDLVTGGGLNFQQEPCENSYYCFPDAYPRLGISLGKRF